MKIHLDPDTIIPTTLALLLALGAVHLWGPAPSWFIPACIFGTAAIKFRL